jgi:gliding motility-associated-like protein
MKYLLIIIFTSLFVNNASGQVPSFVWAGNVGSTGIDMGASIAYDASGNVYVAGRFEGSADFDPGPGVFNLSTGANNEIFVLKLNSSGGFVWAKQFGSLNGDDQGYGIALDNAGNIHVTGYFGATGDFDPGPGTFNLTAGGTIDAFVLKLDNNGNFIWAKKMGGPGQDYANSIALDASGNVYTAGAFGDVVDFDPGAGTFTMTASSSNTAFISKLDASGNFVFAKSFGGSVNPSVVTAIAIDASQNVITTGFFNSTTDFNPGTATTNLTSNGDGDIFISKLDASGNFVWAKSAGAGEEDRGYAVTTDVSGNVLVTGAFALTVDFNPGTGTSNLTAPDDNEDIFILKLDASGNFVWAKGMPGDDYDQGHAIATDAAGNVFTAGFFGETIDFDPGSGTFNLTAEILDIFISKLDASGNFVWALKMGGTSLDGAKDIEIDAAGNIYVTGNFLFTADFDPGPGTHELTYTGNASLNSDAFIVKLGAAGGSAGSGGDLIIYNGISPNADSFNSTWQIKNIDILAETKKNNVTLYNRWGDEVFSASNYDNNSKVFKGISNSGSELPSGTYFYRIQFESGKSTLTGYMVLKK